MSRHASIRSSLKAFFGDARLAAALTTTALGLGVFAFALERMIGEAGLIAMLVTLVPLCAGSLIARRATVEWLAVVPISMLVFLGWATLSVFWSQYRQETLGGVAYLLAFTALGLMVALTRDTIQIIRAAGDVLRATLGLSLALEVLSGLLIDVPIAFLDIRGHIARGGPIQGIVGSHHEVGLLAVIAGITFTIEWRTQSISRGLAVGSLAAAGLTLLLARSPVSFGTAAVAITATAVLYGVRRLKPAQRTFWQLAILGAAALIALAVWMLRSPIVTALNATGDLNLRLRLWQQVWALVPLHPLEGWGWIGQWDAGISPFSLFNTVSRQTLTSAANAYLDVWFQLGLVGIAAFVGMLALAFARSWLLGARQRSVVYTWPAVVLAALMTSALAESSILYEFGWLVFVVCCVKASQRLSWRNAFQRPLEQDPLT
ncbi:O-antigen ligase family protein [Ruicaihuangia caeni]|uniref:O-antigen ligase family protein n=1 Tax=Ruicaihuangia caeni TaxID=3042517 RepID=A0AAW6TEC6_9MICO|nr:O-antigen ligase family protein [Klugiella sp. YN-L-19]MDI2099422.1 O-antigen ligase family protein [Klugiella sp. YN-L-19]